MHHFSLALRVSTALLFGVLSFIVPAQPPVASAAGSILVSTVSPLPAAPITPGATTTFSLQMVVSSTSAGTEQLRLLGYENGADSPILLSSYVSVAPSESGKAVTLTGSYTPSPTANWVVVQAILGPADNPQATVSFSPYLILSQTRGAHAVVYASPSIGPELSAGYLKAYETTWSEVGNLFNSYNEKTYSIFLAANPDVYELVIAQFMGVSAASAALVKNSTTAVNVYSRSTMAIKMSSLGSDPSLVALGHEYAENRFHALLPNNEGAGWFWDGMADTVGLQVAATSTASRCESDSIKMSRWATALSAIRDNRYLPLSSIETYAQWTKNMSDPANSYLQYAEGYTAVSYMQSRFDTSSLVKIVKQPKNVGKLAAAIEQVTGVSMEQLEQDYLASVRPHIGAPPPTIPVSVHLDANGITPQTYIAFTTLYTGGSEAKGYRTATNLPAGDYAFEVRSDGVVLNTDGKAPLTSYKATLTGSPAGRIFVAINNPAYQGKSNTGGYEELLLRAVHGRAGLDYKRYEAKAAPAKTSQLMELDEEYESEEDEEYEEIDFHHPDAEEISGLDIELPSGDCLSPWTDGNQITATIPQATRPGPSLVGPSATTNLPALGTTLRWSNPSDATQYQLQVTPANNDGPALNIVRNAESSFTIDAPELGKGPYIMLPGMTYRWRVRTSNSTTSVGENDPSWSSWSETRSFRTPSRDSNSIGLGQPGNGSITSTSPQTLRWENANSDVFYYELQMSADPTFETDPAKATSFVWTNLVHAGLGPVPNSWVTPELTPRVRYYWRVRPRIQGDGTPVPWSATFTFGTSG